MKTDRNDPEQFIARVLPDPTSLDRAQPLSTQIYRLLREAIVTMAVLPSDVIFERALSETLGISRTPVREALQQLAREELVTIAAQSGTFVAPVRREQFAEGALIRRVLESASIRRAAELISARELDTLHDIHEMHRRAIDREDPVEAIRQDNRFHATVGAAARLPKVLQLIELVRAPIDRVRYVTAREPEEGAMTLAQHQRVLEALLQHDPDAAERALLAHLDDALLRQQRVFDAHVEIFEG
jgi:GntR family transcriptional regulator, rspAB operon transcriptional repressor